jgi:hypothetical protein
MLSEGKPLILCGDGQQAAAAKLRQHKILVHPETASKVS